jgi:hypothetical protein
MNRKLSAAEKRLIERDFVERHEAATRSRVFAHRVFIFGIIAGSGAAVLRGFRVYTPISPLLGIAWLICLSIYLGSRFLPATFSKDIDARWHLNPWQETLQKLSEGRTQVEAITLLAGPLLLRGVCSFIYFGFKS